MKLLMVAASLRKGSLNKKLINIAADLARSQNHEVDLAEFSEFEIPPYNGDLEKQHGVPEGALKFIKRLQSADGLVLASPEYNYSTPGTLKNLIDWVSRVTPMPSGWSKQPILLLAASPSLAGGSRGLIQTQIPLITCGAYLFPRNFIVPKADQAFDDNNQFIDPKKSERLQKMIIEFAEFIKKLKS